MTIKHAANYKGREGLVLVLVLWVLVMLTVLAATLALNTRLDNAVRAAGADRVKARWLARAGVYRAFSEIAADAGLTDAESDLWFDNKEAFEDIALPGGTFTVYADRFKDMNSYAYGVLDEASKVNINTATREMLLALPDMTDTLADAIIDLRQQRQQNRPGALEKTGLEDTPREPASSQPALYTIRQLGWAEQMTREFLYGEDSNFNGILENNENDGEYLPPADNYDGILDRGLLSYVTVYSYECNQDGTGNKRLNINTADQQILQGQLSLHICYVNWILKNRASGFAGIANLLDQTTSKEDTNPGALIDPKKSVPLDVATFRRIADRIGVSDAEIIPGRININTASAPVLQTLPEVELSLAERVIEQRKTLPEGFISIAEILTMEEITIELFKKLAPLITVRSNVFTVRSCGWTERSELKHHIETVVARSPRGLSVLYWKENH
ncbi:helix-hairpin-helix domain-containing protein [Planctomycetota bacterium]